MTVSAQFLLLFNEKGNLQPKKKKKSLFSIQRILLSRGQNNIAYCTGKGLPFESMKEQLIIISVVLKSVEEK